MGDNAPTLDQTGRSPWNDRMTGTTGTNGNINAVPDSGTEEKRRSNKPKNLTKAEQRANNYAKSRFVRDLTSPRGMFNFWIQGYFDELEKMNEKKVGRPYVFTFSFILWVMLIKGISGKDYRFTSGDVGGMVENVLANPYFSKYLPENMRGPDYTTILRRFDSTVFSCLVFPNNVDSRVMAVFSSEKTTNRVRTLAVDSTAMNLSNTNLWRKTKWGVGPIYKGWVKIHALVDVDTNEILAAVISTDKLGDNSAFRLLTDSAEDKGHLFDTIYADSAYEAIDNWKDSEKKNYNLVVKFKCNCNGKSNGSFARGAAAKEYLSMSYDEWRKTTKYGRRWKSESSFSDLKRLVSEHVASITDWGIVKEIVSDLMAYNMFKQSRAKMVGITCNGINVGAES